MAVKLFVNGILLRIVLVIVISVSAEGRFLLLERLSMTLVFSATGKSSTSAVWCLAFVRGNE